MLDTTTELCYEIEMQRLSTPQSSDEPARRTAETVLVSMPWNVPTRPSAALGVLKGGLLEAGEDCAAIHLHVSWVDTVSQSLGISGPDAVDLCTFVAEKLFPLLVGDWIFTVPMPARDASMLSLLEGAGVSQDRIDDLIATRAVVDEFVETAKQRILDLKPRVVGFTSTFSQTMPSLRLAEALKRADDSLFVVFGGSNCDGKMGEALARLYPEALDGVVKGPGESALLSILSDLRAGRLPREQAGFIAAGYRPATRLALLEDRLEGERIPDLPDFAEYFEELSRCASTKFIGETCELPIEMSRGCWWGERHQCKFCGLNGTTMRYRSKSPDKLVAQVSDAVQRYNVRKFFAVDNILGRETLSQAIPQLAESGLEVELFLEVKSNLRRSDLESLRSAGVTGVQPGVETLHDEILQSIDKGVTTFQNLRFLRDCMEVGIRPEWNVILGLPGESTQVLEHMSALVPSLTHLAPPNVSSLSMDRFSPYFENPGSFDLEDLGAPAVYSLVYGVSQAVCDDLAYVHAFRRLADDDDVCRARQQLRERLIIWRKLWSNRPPELLAIREGDGFVIRDQRPGLGGEHRMGDVEAHLYSMALSGARFRRFAEEAARCGLDGTSAERLVASWTERRLVFRDHRSVLGLAVRPAQRSSAANAAEESPSVLDRGESRKIGV